MFRLSWHYWLLMSSGLSLHHLEHSDCDFAVIYAVTFSNIHVTELFVRCSGNIEFNDFKSFFVCVTFVFLWLCECEWVDIAFLKSIRYWYFCSPNIGDIDISVISIVLAESLLICNISTIFMASACHLKMRGDRKFDCLTQGRRSMVIDYYWTVSNVNCKPTTPSITPH